MSQSDRQQIIFCFILAITALAVAMGIGRFAFTPILPLMIQEGTVHLAQTAWLSSSNYIGYLVGALSLLKSKRHPLFVILGLSLVTLTTWLASLSSFGWLLVLRFFGGCGKRLGAGIYQCVCNQLVKIKTDSQQWFDLYGRRYRYHPHRIDL